MSVELVFTHLPKTGGGASFKFLLRKVYGDEGFFHDSFDMPQEPSDKFHAPICLFPKSVRPNRLILTPFSFAPNKSWCSQLL